MALRTWTLSLLLLFLSAAPAMLQDQTTWTLTSAQPVQDIVGDEYNVRSPSLSPDGSAVAWWETATDQVCAFFFEEEQTTCYESPDTLRSFGNYSYPTWSFDGRTLAFTESFFDRLDESDIWILDIESGLIQDLTDDQVFGSAMETDGDTPLDYIPTWNPANGELYFFRSAKSEEGWTTGLYRFVDLEGEPELVVDLTASLPTLSIFQRAAISPDGARMAVSVVGQQLDDEKNGIYLIELADSQLIKIADLADLQTGFPDWAIEGGRLFPEALSWVGNEALVVSASDRQMQTGLTENTVYIDLTNGTVTPLVDLSDVSDAADLLAASGRSGEISRIGVVSPQNDAFLALRYEPNFQGTNVASFALPPASGEPAFVGETPDFRPMSGSMRETFVSADGKALLFGWLLTFEQE